MDDEAFDRTVRKLRIFGTSGREIADFRRIYDGNLALAVGSSKIKDEFYFYFVCHIISFFSGWNFAQGFWFGWLSMNVRMSAHSSNKSYLLKWPSTVVRLKLP